MIPTSGPKIALSDVRFAILRKQLIVLEKKQLITLDRADPFDQAQLEKKDFVFNDYLKFYVYFEHNRGVGSR